MSLRAPKSPRRGEAISFYRCEITFITAQRVGEVPEFEVCGVLRTPHTPQIQSSSASG